MTAITPPVTRAEFGSASQPKWPARSHHFLEAPASLSTNSKYILHESSTSINFWLSPALRSTRSRRWRYHPYFVFVAPARPRPCGGAAAGDIFTIRHVANKWLVAVVISGTA